VGCQFAVSRLQLAVFFSEADRLRRSDVSNRPKLELRPSRPRKRGSAPRFRSRRCWRKDLAVALRQIERVFTAKCEYVAFEVNTEASKEANKANEGLSTDKPSNQNGGHPSLPSVKKILSLWPL
jgi:hypothetical protein